MKKFKFGVSFLIITFLLFIAFFNNIPPQRIEAKHYSKEQITKIMSLVIPCAVFATLKEDAFLYSDPDRTSDNVCFLYEGAEVEILKDKTMKWYYVKDNSSNKEGWIHCDNIVIPEDSPPNNSMMSTEQIEGFVNLMDFESRTKYFVWTDIDRQVTHIFKGKKNNWELIKTLTCSTGKNSSPTSRGVFTIKERGLWFYSERLKSGGQYWVRFNGTYLFHTVAMDKHKNVIDPVLGEKRSSGCVRFKVSEAKWFYENVPDTSTVFIH